MVDINFSSSGDLKARLRFMQRENQSLVSRVASLEEDIKSLNVQLDHANKTLLSFQTHKHIGINTDENGAEFGTYREARYRETCNFCDLMRCRTCEKRIKVIPSVIPIILKNGFIGIKELGNLACVSRGLKQCIYVDIVDIWSMLLHEKWPCTTKIPQHIFSSLSYRAWYERLTTAVCPGAVELYDESRYENVHTEHYRREENENARRELVSRRNNYVRELKSMSDTADEFPPHAAPSLAANDIMFLVDISCTGKKIVSSAIVHKSGEFLTFSDDDKLCDIIVHQSVDDGCYDPVKLRIDEHGDFQVDLPSVNGSIYAVRLTDLKIIYLTSIIRSSLDSSLSSTDKIDEGSMENLMFPKLKTQFYGNAVGSIPTLLTSRIRYFEDNDKHFCDFLFVVHLTHDIPRSPRHFGHKYTVEQFEMYRRTNRDYPEQATFIEHSLDLWFKAASKPELARFFEQAKNAGVAISGEYVGKISKIGLSTHIYAEDISGKLEHMFFNTRRGRFGGVTLLHVLEDLFNHNEPPVDIRKARFIRIAD